MCDTGQQFDDLTGLYNLRARYYAPNAGRFLSRDICACNMQNFVELNRYVYTTNNPISFRDPSGFSSISIDYGSTLGTISAPALGGLPPLGFKTGVIILGSIAVLLATVETATHLFAKKSDLKQVRAAGLAAGISPGCLKEWGKFVEQAKQSGFFGSANDRGDFTWGELLDLAEEFLDLFPRCRSG